MSGELNNDKDLETDEKEVCKWKREGGEKKWKEERERDTVD